MRRVLGLTLLLITALIHAPQVRPSSGLRLPHGAVQGAISASPWMRGALGPAISWLHGTEESNSKDAELSLRRQLEMLQLGIRRQTPDEVVKTWASGVMTRNGALQFAVLSPYLQEQTRADFEAVNWLPPPSSPWVEGFAVIVKDEYPDGSFAYTVEFTYTDSTGFHSRARAAVVVASLGWDNALLSSYEGHPDQWGVTSVDYP